MERLLRVAVAALLIASTLSLVVVGGSQPVRISPELAALLRAPATERIHLFVHATSADAAFDAAEVAGLRVINRFERVGVVSAVGSPDAVRSVIDRRSVTYVEHDRPVSLLMETSHVATRSEQARQGFVYDYEARAADGTVTTETGASGGVDGSGVSIAVVDSGIDGTHPMFQIDGRSKVVRNLRIACVLTEEPCLGQIGDAPEELFVDAPDNNSEVTLVGHGTHVAGTAAGTDVVTADGRRVRGAAPGASLIGLSVGASASVLGYANALNWILEHHRQPCAAEVADCPPIRVVNNSYGGSGDFDPDSVVTKIQRALIAEGVVMVWAAGNDGGDGTSNLSNALGQDPTPGSIMVANYWDHDNGSREGELDSASSRGMFGHHATYPDISAPGANIVSACRPTFVVCQLLPIGKDVDAGADPNYASSYGTSMAAPHVTGIVAQLLQARPDLTPAEVENILEDTAHPFPFGGRYEPDPTNPDHAFSYDKGHGLVDATNAVVIARRLQGWPDGGISCPPNAPVSRDPGGDAKGAGFLTVASHDSAVQSSAAGNEPSLDIRDTTATFTAESLEIAVEVTDLRETEPSGATGTVVDLDFGRGGAEYAVQASRGAGAATAVLVDGDSNVIADAIPATFDAINDRITISIPSSAWTGAGLAPWQINELITLRSVATRRLVGVLLSMSDGAGPYCSYRLGSGATTETPPGGHLGADPNVPAAAEGVSTQGSASLSDGDSYRAEGAPADVQANHTCSGPGDPLCFTYAIDVRPGDGSGVLDVAVTALEISDYDLYIYDAALAEVGTGLGSPVTVLEEAAVAVTTGRYYVVVQPYAATPQTPFTLEVSLS